VVAARLAPLLRSTGAGDFQVLVQRAAGDRSGELIESIVDAITVNRTEFFREPAQFPVFEAALLSLLEHTDTVSVWSAGCATGEEAYTLAMLAHKLVTDAASRVRILATDISRRVLSVARAGIYDDAALATLPTALLPCMKALGKGRWEVVPEVRRLVTFAHHNLVGPWPMSGPMHVVFCRNVMLYFDPSQQRPLMGRFHELLAPGGFLFIGHSEILPATPGLAVVHPAVYRKLDGTQ
jgi:chemotaxis protein methyltransferase CheR